MTWYNLMYTPKEHIHYKWEEIYGVETMMNENKEQTNQAQIEQSQENKESIDLDMNKFGALEINQGNSKPQFNKRKPITFIRAVLKTTPNKKKDQDQTYYPVFLGVEYEYANAQDNTIKQAYESYGGGRLFTHTKPEKSEKPERFWVGNDSALGKLVKLLKETFDTKGVLNEIPMYLIGKRGEMLTETQTVAGKEYIKNIIKAVHT